MDQRLQRVYRGPLYMVLKRVHYSLAASGWKSGRLSFRKALLHPAISSILVVSGGLPLLLAIPLNELFSIFGAMHMLELKQLQCTTSLGYLILSVILSYDKWLVSLLRT